MEKRQKNTNLKEHKITMKKVKNQVKGITLIALVVTIIVLLILAGVALSLTVGNNGLFTRAENAANTWQMAEQNEQKEMEQAGDFIKIYQRGVNTATTVKEAIDQDGFYLENTKIEDDLGNEVVIPAYFKLASDSATKVEDGIVIEDLSGNQFVWIPVSVPNEETGEKTPIHTTTGDITINYARIDFGLQSGSYSNYSETLPTDEIESINDNGGYYIGRYEAGDGNSTDFRTSATEGTVVIKKNQIPYNWITRANAEIKATEMATVQGYTTATTKLVSSYAWDTALDFLQKANSDNEHSDYATSSPEGNYYDSEFDYAILGETEKNSHKNPNEAMLVPTGQTTAVSNIYDMGGNLWERTTESVSYDGYPYVIRGGVYSNGYYNNHPAGYRGGSDGYASNYDGFRVTLYCSTES